MPPLTNVIKPLSQMFARGAAQVARPAAAVYKGYNKVTAPLSSHLVNKLPQAYRPMGRGFAAGTGATLTAAAGADVYNTAAESVGNSARQLAQRAGLNDEGQLDVVSQRAQNRMLPIAWKAMAPKWLGGASTPLGQEIAKDLRTVAYHNVMPSLFRPAPSAAQRPLATTAMTALTKGPVSALSPYVVSPRPTAQQMWQNTPPEVRRNLGRNLFTAAQQPGNVSFLGNEARHIFEPVLQHYGMAR